MKKHAKTIKRFVAMALSVVMVISLFPNGALRAFAEELADAGNSIVLDFVPENGVPEVEGMNSVTGTIRNDSIKLYKSTDYGAEGVEVEGVQGVVVTVLTSHTIDDVKMYEIDCTEEANEEIFDLVLDYSFVSSTDIMLEGEESLPAPTPYPAIIPSSVINDAYNSLLATTTSADYDSTYGGISADIINRFSAEQKAAVELHKAVLVAYETLMATETVASYDSVYTTCDPVVLDAFTDAQKAAISAHRAEMYDAENPDTGIYLELPEGEIAQAGTPSGALAAINGTSVIAYKSLDNGAMGVEISVSEGTVVELITSYTFSNSDRVFYRYDYTGSNEELKDAATGETYGYAFIPATSVTITNEVGTNSYTDEEYGITVSGQIPTGLTLDVAPEDADAILAGSDALMGGGEWTYDVDLTYPGGEYKTTQGIDVTFEKENIQFPAGANYKAYHIKEDNSVEVLGPFVYDGNDIEVTFNSLSPVGLSADVININSRPFEKAVFKNSTVKVYPSDKDNAEPKTLTGLTSADIIVLADGSGCGYTMTDGTTRYYIYEYLGSNSELQFLNTGSMYSVDINDIEEYVESSEPEEPEQPEEVVNAYENLIKAPTLDDFDDMLDEYYDSGVADSFTDAQWDEIDEIESALISMDEATEDMADFGFEGTIIVENAKLYLNPVTWPEEYVTVETIMVSDEDEGSGIAAENAIVEGEYTADNGDIYYIIDTSAWAAFAGKTPYKYVNKGDFGFDGDWTRVNGKGYFLSDEIKIYDNTGKTYRRITDGLSKGAFDVLYSFHTDNGDGTVTNWYIINTTGWTDVNGSTFKNRLVKQEDVNLITAETITAAYNDMLRAASVEKFDELYNDAQTNGIIDCLTDEQKQNLADTRATLVGMQQATTDLSQYNLEATFANEETKLYPNPVTNPDEYITAVVENTSLLSRMFSTFSFFLTVHAAGEEVTAQEIVITGKYLADDGTLYYILDVSAWDGLPEGVDTLYVKASEIDIYVDEATQTTFVDLLTAQSGEELAEMLAELDENTVAVMTEAGLVDLAESHAEVIEFLAENGSTPVADDSVVGMYAQPIEGTETVFLYANPDQFTDGMTYYDLPSDEFKTIFKITEVMTNEFGKAVYYKMNVSYPAKDGTEPCSWIRADAVEILEGYIDPAEALYLRLMQTETLEAWFEIIESLTDEQLQLFDEMDETMSTELEEHVDSLTSAIDKEKTDTLAALLSAATAEEYINIRRAVTEDIEALFSGTDYIAMHDHITALVDAEDTSPDNVVDYTYSAPLVIPDYTFVEEAAVYNMRSRALMAASNDVAVIDDDGESADTPAATPEGTDTTNPAIKDTAGVVTNKTVTDNEDGTYTVNLETYVTGEKVTTAVEKQIPTDIIIVVDQSGSMEFDMNKSTTYDRINGTAEEIYNTDKYADKVYVNVGTTASPVYKKVTMTAETADTYVPARTLYDTNSELRNFVNNGGDLYYKATETSTPAEVEITRSGRDNYGQRTYTYTATGLNESSYGNDATPSFLDKLYIKTDAITKITFSYKDANDQTVTKEYLPTDSVPKDSDNIVGNTYYYQNVSTSEYRLDALVRALNNFAASVEEKAKGDDGVWGPNPAKDNVNDDVNHRIAIVGFSSSVGTYHNTEILTGCDISTGSSHNNEYGVYYPLGVEKNGVMYNSTDYAAATRTALVSMDTTAGQTSVENAIKALTAHGGTQTDHGLDMAADILAAEAAKGTEYTKVVNGVTTTVRNKIVILFTDGSPTSSSGFETSVANSAIGYAKTIKNTHNATLYGVGIFDNADARVLTNNDKTNAYLPTGLTNENKFMHFVSSNFKNAENMSTGYDTNNGTSYNTETFHQDSNGKYTGRSYYLSASNSDALNNIFQTISEESVTNATVVELNETTVVKDIVAPNFSVPADASNVTVRVDEVNSTTGQFKNNPQTVAGVSASIDGTDVNVTGFDFAENWVGSETAADGTVTYRGKKLIITFDIPVDPDFMGGNKVKTNGNNSGVYGGDGALVENFVRPTQDIELKNITATWQNQHIYRTNNADIKALFLAAKVNGKDASEVINGENNAYVDIVFTITGPNGKVAEYTIDAGKDFAEGGWDDESALTPALTADAEYTLSWTITPIYTGEVKAVSGSATAKVFVYDPVLTFKDSTGYYGGTVPTLNDTNNLVSEIWKNPTTGNLSTDDTVTMHGTKPTLVPSYTLGTGVSNDIIITKNDIPVNVTVKIGDTDVTGIVGFEHQDCADAANDEPMPVFSGTGDDADYAELVVHVDTAQLTISKTVDPNGAASIPDDTFEFTVDQTVSSEFAAGTRFLYSYNIYNVGSDAPVKTDIIYSGAKGIALKHNQYIVLTGLPLGSYTVTETENPKYETTATGATGTLTATAPEATAAFTNKLSTGDLTINKVVSMPAGFAVTEGEKFEFTVTGPNGYSQKVTITVDKDGKGSTTLENVVQGEYTVVETAKDLYTTAYSLTNGKVTVPAGGAAEITVTNTAKTGELEINKVVSMPEGFAVTAGETFTFTVTGPNGYKTTRTITVDENGAGTVKLTNLVPGTYTVAETENSLYTTTYSVVDGKVAVTANEKAAVTVTNTAKTGKLVINKTVVMPEGFAVPADETFTFTVKGPNGYTATRNITVNAQGTGTVEITNLIPGDYTVVETAKDLYTADKASQNVAVTAGGTATAAVTNTMHKGNLVISKNVVKVNNVDLSNENFIFKVKVNGNGEAGYTITRADSTTTDGTITFTNGVGTITLKDGESVEIKNVPAGAYVVEETAAGSAYEYTTTSTGASGTIADGGKATAAFTNSMNYGSLTVTKEVVAPTGFNPNTDKFTFTVTVPNAKELTYTIDGAVKTVASDTAVFELTDGQTATFNSIFAGAKYTVTENEESDYSTVKSGDSGIIESGKVSAAKFTNTLNNSSLVINKEVVVPTGFNASADEFTFTVTFGSSQELNYKVYNVVAEGDDTVAKEGTIKSGGTLTLKHKQYAVIDGMPVGAFTVTETANADYTTTATGGTFTAAELKVSGRLTSDGASVKFVNTAKKGSLVINKDVVMPEGFAATENEVFTFTVTGPKGYNETKTITVDVNGDGSIEITDLVVGEYTVVEKAKDLYTTAYSPADGKVAVTEDAKAAVTVTNTAKTGELVINKTVVMPAGFAVPAGETFEFTVTGPNGYTATRNIAVNAQGTGTVTLTNLVPGTYRVEETAKDLYIADKASQNVAVTEGGTATAKVTNTARTNSLVINKDVVMPTGFAATAGETFEFTVTGPNGYTTTRTITVDANGEGSVEIANLLLGEYKVVETTNNLYTTTYSVADGKVTVARGAKAEITVTNTAKTGSLVINKDVVMPEGFAATAGEVFEFAVTGPNGYEETKTITVDTNGDGYVEITNLIPGEYTVVETANDLYATTYSLADGKVTVTAGDTAEITVTNTALKGGFSVTKTVENEAENYTPSKDETFEMVVTVDGYAAGTALTYKIGNTEHQTDVNGKFTIKAGQTAVFSDLLTGKTFTVTENLSSAQTAIYSKKITTEDSDKAGAKVYTIEAGETERIVVTNTVKVGNLTVTKEVDAKDVDVSNERFAFTVTSAQGGAIEGSSFTLGDGGSKTFRKLLVGSYTVTETADDKYVTTVNGTADNSKTVTVTECAETEPGVKVEFVNTLDKTELTITKKVSDDSNTTLNVTDSFIFNVYKNGTLETTIVLQADESVKIPDVKVGDVYRVEEVGSWSWRFDAVGNTVIEKTIAPASIYNTFEFENTVEDPLYWLDNESQLENKWTANGITKVYNYN